jgi:hypothetical protein
MKKSLAVCLLVLALGGLAACASVRGGSGWISECSGPACGVGSLPRQERVVLELRMDGDTCKIDMQTPPDIRTQSGAVVSWLFIGGCDNAVQIGIAHEVEDKDGRKRQLFNLNHKDTHLSRAAPPHGKGPPMRLTGVIGTIPQNGGRYKYTVLIDGKPAKYNPDALRGDFIACPNWPCGDFENY